ncbi:MAG: MTH938/NDUFAF3 family protein [Mariprofundales bacterium]|nr:MTH938/NDUFAF3 family protein [Mariprofundales bacterium]
MFRGYAPDYFMVGRVRITSSLTIHHQQIDTPWEVDDFAGLVVDRLQWLLDSPPELLLLGSGRLTRFPSAEVCDWLHAQHIPFESMDSRSAARTWNILMGEGRQAACAMLLPGV